MTTTVATLNYTRSQNVAIGVITKLGMVGALRRNGAADRQCTIFIRDYLAVERVGRVMNPTDRMVLIAPSPSLLATPPNRDLDRLVQYVQPVGRVPVEVPGGELRITEPVVPFAPAGVVLYWKVPCRL